MPNEPAAHTEPGSDARSDLIGGLAWMALGIVILVMSWQMDRLEDQDINPYTIPGLVPGLLGAAMMLLSGVMILRGARRGGFSAEAIPAPQLDWSRLGLVVLLCVGFAAVLLGRVPFWLAAWMFVSSSILVLRWREIAASRARGIAMACVIGLCTGLAVSLVFERLFLVRLP